MVCCQVALNVREAEAKLEVPSTAAKPPPAFHIAAVAGAPPHKGASASAGKRPLAQGGARPSILEEEGEPGLVGCSVEGAEDLHRRTASVSSQQVGIAVQDCVVGKRGSGEELLTAIHVVVM